MTNNKEKESRNMWFIHMIKQMLNDGYTEKQAVFFTKIYLENKVKERIARQNVNRLKKINEEVNKTHNKN